MRTRTHLAAAARSIVLQLCVLIATSTCLHAQESWDAVYLAGAKIGFIHTFVEKVPNKGKTYLRVRMDMEMRLKRGNDVAVTELKYGTIETMDGQVLKLDTRTTAGAGSTDLRAHGNVIDGKMTLVLEGTGERQELSIPWSSDVRGPYAAEQSMARAPMKENEVRQIKMFVPDLNKVCDVELKARGLEPVILGDKQKRLLLRVDQITRLDGKPRPEFDARLFVDAQGQVLKSEQDMMGGVVTYRTTEEGAKSAAGPIQFDLIKNTVIKVAARIPTSDRTRYVRYQLKMPGGDLSDVIPADARQQFLPGGAPELAVLDVRSMGPADGAPAAPVDAQFTKPNALVTSQDSQVRALTQRATRGAKDVWQKVERINHFVFEKMTDKNFNIAFAAASEVARDLSGDCTEHAVLAAAMYRAAGIPSRVAVGLIYVEQQGGFGYHMWNEVFVNQRWVALDPSFDQSTVDAAHIKLSDSSLEGVSPFETFLPVLKVAGKLEITPIEFR
jgi:hypothetical protein